jgi:hypothetical protein
MKIAIVCDWLVTYAGAERLLEGVLQCYPEADLFAVVDYLYPEIAASKKALSTLFAPNAAGD